MTPAIEGVAEMGLPITNQVRCLGINEQVAQKLHACTGPQRQDRARDILDILVVDMLGRLDRVRARATTERIFGERNTHPVPPETIIPPEWQNKSACRFRGGYSSLPDQTPPPALQPQRDTGLPGGAKFHKPASVKQDGLLLYSGPRSSDSLDFWLLDP